jgi:hypothetical protein
MNWQFMPALMAVPIKTAKKILAVLAAIQFLALRKKITRLRIFYSYK